MHSTQYSFPETDMPRSSGPPHNFSAAASPQDRREVPIPCAAALLPAEKSADKSLM